MRTADELAAGQAAWQQIDYSAPPRLSVEKWDGVWWWTILRPVVDKPWYSVGTECDAATTHAEALAVGLAALEAATVTPAR